MRKVLVGIHDKYCSLRAVEYLIKECGNRDELEVTLVNVFPNLPVAFWDDGHILTPEEEAERQQTVNHWAGKQRDYIEPILQSAAYDLARHGFRKELIQTRFLVGTTDVADSLLDEAKRLGCKTIVLGRCGVADGKHFAVGSKVSKLINNATGIAVCVVQ